MEVLVVIRHGYPFPWHDALGTSISEWRQQTPDARNTPHQTNHLAML